MISPKSHAEASVFHRMLWLYGLHAILSNAFFLVGYYLLPEGFMRGSPTAGPAELVAKASGFWPQFGLTLLFNLGCMTVLIVMLNFNTVREFPVGYVLPVSLGVTGGLIVGTNSFVASDLSRYNAREGLALGLSIGGVEMLGYILIIASTVRFGVYQYRSWWRWSGEWKPTKSMRIRDVRLSKEETFCLALGALLIIFAAYRETVMPLTR
jgi:hypothetical protein